MDLQGLVEAANKKGTATEEKSVDGNEIYASLVFIQNAIQNLKTQQNEQNKNYEDNNQKLNLKINNCFANLQKSISAVPVQTQTLTVSEIKEIIKGLQDIEKSALNVCNELQVSRNKVQEAIMALKFIILLTPVCLITILICYHWFFY